MVQAGDCPWEGVVTRRGMREASGCWLCDYLSPVGGGFSLRQFTEYLMTGALFGVYIYFKKLTLQKSYPNQPHTPRAARQCIEHTYTCTCLRKQRGWGFDRVSDFSNMTTYPTLGSGRIHLSASV